MNNNEAKSTDAPTPSASATEPAPDDYAHVVSTVLRSATTEPTTNGYNVDQRRVLLALALGATSVTLRTSTTARTYVGPVHVDVRAVDACDHETTLCAMCGVDPTSGWVAGGYVTTVATVNDALRGHLGA